MMKQRRKELTIKKKVQTVLKEAIMKDKMGYKFILTIIVASLFFHTPGFGAGRVDLEPLVSVDDSYGTYAGKGKIKIEPMITVAARKDSNFYKSETDEKGVYTYLVQPGIKVGYETGKSDIFLGYTLNATYYDGDRDDYLGHTLNFSASTKLFSRLALALQDSFYKTRDPGRADKFSNSVSREKYFINRLTPKVLYEFENKFSFGLGYQNTITEYDQAGNEGSEEHKGMLDLIYNFTPTTRLDFQYHRWERDYDLTTSDYKSDQVNLIFAKQFRRLSLEAGGGYHKRRFDNGELDDMDVFSYRLAASWQGGQRSGINFAAERNFNDSCTGNSYFKETQFSLSANRVFREILTNIKGKYKISDYMTDDRKDDTFSISADLGYMINKWLTFNIGAGYEKRDSNLAGYDYENKYIMGNIDFRYSSASR